jgi:hypothetical protein
MSSDETPKIEPTLTDAPSIAPDIKPEAVKSEAAEAPRIEAPKAEAPEIKVEARAEPAKIEPKVEAKAEAKAEAPTLPLAPQIEPAKAIILPGPQPKTERPAAQGRNSRFVLLAACVAIAASIGAIGGSLAVAKFAPMLTAPPAPVIAAAPKDNAAEELKALKETVTQLRTATRSLSENLATLKVSVSTSNVTQNAQNAQIGKIAETLERLEKAQAEQRKIAAAPQPAPQPTPDVTGSVSQKQATPVPMVLGDPPTTLKPPILHDYVLRRVYDGAALIEGRNGIIEVEAGIVAPGIGRIEAIKRQDGRWVVVTARGLIVQR